MSGTLQHALTVNPGATPWTQITTADGGAANISACISAAIAQLQANPSTKSTSGNRTYQEALNDIFEGINTDEPIFI
jgi:hypothetical protein